MNELSTLFLNVLDGDTVTLEMDKIYNVRQDDSYVLEGFFCSNTAKQDENPDGKRFSAVYLNDRKNVIIDGNGATILVHGKMTPILFYRCENITVRNLTIDYAVPTMTEFTVLDSDNGVITIRINEDCLWRVDGNVLYWCGEKGSDGTVYWENACNAPKRYVKVFSPETETTRDFSRNDLTFQKIEVIGKNILKCTLLNSAAVLKKGEIVQTRNIMRDQVGSMFERCRNLTFENLRVKFMHGLGMVSQFSENITFKNCDFTPGENRTIASTADFFQFSGCKGNIVIENCCAFGAQDDYVNVHGTHLRVIETDPSECSILVRFMHAESWGFQAFETGDDIEFIRWDTLEPYDDARIIAYEKLNNTDIKIIVSKLPAGIIAGKDVVENITYRPNLYVRNCHFGPTSGRGILATTGGEVIIENNCFFKLCGPALLIEDDCNFWFESGYTKNITFRNNEVISCNFGKTMEIAPVIQCTPKVMNEVYEGFVHERLNVYGNRFLNSLYGNHTFYLEYLKEIEIHDNSFDAPFELITKKCGFVRNDNNVTV